MTTLHHTPYATGAPLTAATLTAPLSQLDSAIQAVISTGSGTSTTLTAQATAASTGPFSVASSAGLLPGDVVFFGDAGGTNESRIVNTVPGGGLTFTVTVALTNTYAIGKPVSKSPIEIVGARGAFGTLQARLADDVARIAALEAYNVNTGVVVSTTVTTVDATGADQITFAVGAGHTIATITGGVSGQLLVLYATATGSTIQHTAAGIELRGGVNATLPSKGTLVLRFMNNRWMELARNFITNVGLTISTTITTFDATGIDQVSLTTASGHSIATATGGISGQEMYFIAFAGNTTLVHNTIANTFRLRGAINVVVPNGAAMLFRFMNSQWYEVSRSF
jgi:hypothetical protein